MKVYKIVCVGVGLRFDQASVISLPSGIYNRIHFICQGQVVTAVGKPGSPSPTPSLCLYIIHNLPILS